MIGELLERSHLRRKRRDRIMCALLLLAAIACIVPLLWVFSHVLIQGLPALDWSFFTRLPAPVGETGGGMANALLGTVILVAVASALGIPWGIATGVFLSEYGNGRRGGAIRFAVDMLASIPSIIIGLFVYAILVLPMKQFSALAGGLALGILIVPTVARSTEEILKLVPLSIREAGLALGLPRWKVILMIVLKGSVRPLATGGMLAIARAAGETAPLLFTAFSNQYWSTSLTQPIASLPVQIYTYAISPFEDWHRQAWAGAFLLVMVVLFFNILTRLVLGKAKVRV